MSDELDYSPYKIQLDMFSGPMDLLLYLIRREEVEATEIPVSTIADQYISYIEMMELVDLNIAGDFLVMAATLMEIKSRMLLPIEDQEGLDEEDEIDPGSELLQRLLEYKRFKEASLELQTSASRRERMFGRPEGVIQIPQEWIEEELKKQDPLKGVTLWDLLNSFSSVMARAKPIVQAKVTYEDAPLPVFFHRITDLLREKSPRSFLELFRDAKDRGQIVGTFLAILELARLQRLRIVQTETFGEIWVEWVSGSELSDEELEEAKASLGARPEEHPDYDNQLDVTAARIERGGIPDEGVGASAAAPAAEDIDIETLRSRAGSAKPAEPADASDTPLPGFVAVDTSDLASGGPEDWVDDDAEEIADFDEYDEIDRALAEISIVDLDKEKIYDQRFNSGDQPPAAAPENAAVEPAVVSPAN